MAKKILSLLLAGIMLLSVSGTAMAADDTLTIWLEAGNEDWLSANIELFNALYPDVEVEATFMSTDDIKNQCKIAASSGTLPDLWWNWGGSLGLYYTSNGLCYDLTDLAAELKFDEVFNDAALESASLDGVLYGVPRLLSTYGIIYHKPTLEAAGWTETSTTFAEFEQMLEDIKTKTDKTPLCFASGNGWQMMRLMMYLLDYYCGDELFASMRNMEVPWNNEGAVAALNKLKEWADKGYFPEGYLTLQPNDTRMLLYAGLGAMTSGSISELDAIIDEGYDISEFAIMPFPDESEDGYTQQSTGANVIQINANLTPEKARMAAEFAMLTSDPACREQTGNSLVGYGARLDYEGDIEQAQELTEYTNAYGSMTLIDQALSAENCDVWFYVQDVVCEGTMTAEEALAYFDANVVK